MQKHHFDVFWHEKHFEKQPQSHSQTDHQHIYYVHIDMN
jgi:hypothetical protein